MSATVLPIGPPGRVFVPGIGRAFSFQIPGRSIQLLVGPTDDHRPASKSINSPIRTTCYNCVGSVTELGCIQWAPCLGFGWIVV